jgi:signal transduction histidine kinase
VDAGTAVLVALACLPGMVWEGSAAPAGGLDWLALAALVLPLFWRRRAPVVVFWAVITLTSVSGFFDVDIPAQAIVPAVALYTLARHRSRAYLWPAVGAWAAALGLARLAGDLSWASLAGLSGFFAAATMLGVTIRTRAAYLAELEARALRLERERDQQTQLAAAAERARIAREMHDIVAHNLAVMIALADGATLTSDQAPERAAEAMRQASETGREALAEMRRLLGVLRDARPSRTGDAAELAPQPGLEDIDRLVDQVRGVGLHVTVSRKGVPGPWGPGAGLAIYRIVQEALTNTLKHAGAGARADVRLRYTTKGVAVTVLDDGAKRPRSSRAAPTDGHGLSGMAERAAPYGGVVKAGPRRGAGWYVHARLRFDAPSVA